VIELPSWDEQVSEVEAMVRSAANYVQVSKDLRPRVLEMARLANGERRARRCIRQVALAAALLTWVVTTSVSKLDMRDDLRQLTLVAAGPYAASNRETGEAGEAAWSLVDAFTDLRCRQAEVLRPAL
jgi:hypothetical protein